MKINVFVTGATSQIGIFLLPILHQDRFKIYALSRTKKKNYSNVIWINSSVEDFRIHELREIKIDILIHLAEITLLECIINKLANIKQAVAFSSTSVITKINSKNIQERHMAQGLQHGENRFKKICNNKKIKWTIFRPTLIYGANKDKNITFISNFIKKYRFFPILGDGAGLRQPVHAYDLAKSCLNVIENRNCYNKIYNLRGNQTLTYSEMVGKIFFSLEIKEFKVKLPKFIFLLIIKIAKIIPAYSGLNSGMIDRLDENLCFDIKDAQEDFNYRPHDFIPNIKI